MDKGESNEVALTATGSCPVAAVNLFREITSVVPQIEQIVQSALPQVNRRALVAGVVLVTVLCR